VHHMCKHITAISRELTAAEKRAAGATMSAMLYPLRVGCISLFQARNGCRGLSRAFTAGASRCIEPDGVGVSCPRAGQQPSRIVRPIAWPCIQYSTMSHLRIEPEHSLCAPNRE